MINKIYENKKTESKGDKPTCEISKADNIEEKFIYSICEKLFNVLNINFRDRRIFIEVLKSSLTEHICKHHEGLLFQYEQYLFDEASERIIDTFKLKSSVNYNNATHARFADIVKELEKLRKEENNGN